MHPSLAHQTHRPWPIPTRRWTWRQSWLDVLFLHWPVPADVLQPLVPAGLQIQSFDGTSWVGVVPFRMAGVMRRPFPDLPWVSAFPELNVRLYVEADGRPGVWFLSLDATNALAVWAARTLFYLPYYRCAIHLNRTARGFRYTAERSDRAVRFEGTYQPEGPANRATPGTLDHWLTERYCLYAEAPDGSLLRNEVHHAPWPLQPASADISTNTMLAPYGIDLRGDPLCHFSPGVDVIVWSAHPLAGS